MKKTSILIVALFAMILTSCGTMFVQGGGNYRAGLSAYNDKEYLVAIEELNKALAVNPELVEAAGLYPMAFNEGVNHYTSIATSISNPNTPKDAETVLFAYANLSALFEKAKINAGRFNLDIKDVSEKVSDAKLLAGELWFRDGESLVREGSRDSMIKAVSAFEKAKKYDLQNPDLEKKIAYAIDEATIKLMIIGTGRLKDCHDGVIAQFQEKFKNDRFVEIIDEGDFYAEDSMVGPLDIAIQYGVNFGADYVLEVYSKGEFKEIDKTTKVTYPDSNPIFRGYKTSRGYQKNMEYSYLLFDLKTQKFVWEYDLKLPGELKVFETTALISDISEKALFPGDKERDWEYLVTSKDNELKAKQIVEASLSDLNSLLREANVIDATDVDEWVDYFTNNMDYYLFSSFIKALSGKVFPYSTQGVVLTATKIGEEEAFFMLGRDPEESFKIASTMTAINLALRKVADNQVESVKEYNAWSFDGVASVADTLREIF